MSKDTNNEDFDLDEPVEEVDSWADEVSSQQTPDSIDQPGEQNHVKPKGIKAKFKDLWQNPKKRWSLIVCFVLILITVFLTPTSRYFVLNSVGVRSSASVKILDESTSQPLKNVSVKLGIIEAKTNDDGLAAFTNIKQGKTKLIISKRAFAQNTQDVTLGWGSNPLGEKKIKPVGLQYSFEVKDFLSEKPIEKAEATSGEYSAFSDKDGKLVLTIDQPNEEEINIMIRANGYRVEAINQLTDSKDTKNVLMSPEKKHLFVSKRSGKYDVYKIDADGKNEQLILSGTGSEREDMVLAPSPDKNLAALVSTRDSARNKDGYLLSTLTLLDLSEDEVSTNTITRSEKIQIIGWSNEQLVFVKIADGASAETPDRHRLITYNTETGDTKELAKSNYFNDVLMIGDDVYYAPSAALQTSKTALFKVNSKGENQKTIFDSEAWNIFRTDYDTLMFSVHDDWYDYEINSGKVLAAAGAPPTQATRIYVDNPNESKSLWIDQRDGKGTLLAYDINSKEDKTIKSQSGLAYPVTWLNNDTAIYRINTNQETADFIVNINEGKSKKIRDVTSAGGIEGWRYY